jgi:hypothetical protein
MSASLGARWNEAGRVLRNMATAVDSGAAYELCKLATSELGIALGAGACIAPLRSPWRIPTVPGNGLWRTVTVLPLADRKFQPYAGSVTIAASIDRAGVRPLLSAPKPHHESYRCS